MRHESNAFKQDILGIELRFLHNTFSELWVQTLNTIFVWDPSLLPTHIDRLSDIDAKEAEPWSRSLIEEIAQRCATKQRFAWMLFREDEGEIGMSIALREDEVEMSMGLKRPTIDLVDYFQNLLIALEGKISPMLGMLFDRNSPNAELVMQGLRGLKDVPPLLYLDAQAIEIAGGIDWLRTSPCEKIDMPGSGLLLVTRLPWGNPSPEERRNIKALKQFLGIANSNPLVLIKH